MSVEMFNLIAIGLAHQEHMGKHYPYPPTLQQGLNLLALKLGAAYPPTIQDVRQLLAQPLEEWWQWDLPSAIDPRFGILDQNLKLDDQVIEYLSYQDLTGMSEFSLTEVGIRLDNQLMRDLLDVAYRDYDLSPLQAEENYRQARRFIIENPTTNPEELADEFYQPSSYRELVMAMYESARVREASLVFEDNYWLCSVCGLLNKGRESIKSSLCEIACPGEVSWQNIPTNPRLRILKRGIQLRTMIPGVAELRIYRHLESLNERSRYFKELTLWPGIDRYDVRITFDNNEVWALDIKDFKNPYQLGQQIASDTQIYGVEPRIKWDRFFFMVPDYRTHHYPDYLEIAQHEAASLANNVAIVTEGQFRYLIEQELWMGS